eukprot:TRINITY_DN4197_c0_g2_i1.p1 TRINITY_DN4197_c0_g2~~TRINITY_DN4197_c0_g2_i1.p1  ORF type:complete len:1147 (+),score=93.82 TRINITY_DN4197_c0_g2_i1:62-3502(+)
MHCLVLGLLCLTLNFNFISGDDVIISPTTGQYNLKGQTNIHINVSRSDNNVFLIFETVPTFPVWWCNMNSTYKTFDQIETFKIESYTLTPNVVYSYSFYPQDNSLVYVLNVTVISSTNYSFISNSSLFQPNSALGDIVFNEVRQYTISSLSFTTFVFEYYLATTQLGIIRVDIKDENGTSILSSTTPQFIDRLELLTNRLYDVFISIQKPFFQLTFDIIITPCVYDVLAVEYSFDTSNIKAVVLDYAPSYNLSQVLLTDGLQSQVYDEAMNYSNFISTATGLNFYLNKTKILVYASPLSDIQGQIVFVNVSNYKQIKDTGEFSPNSATALTYFIDYSSISFVLNSTYDSTVVIWFNNETLSTSVNSSFYYDSFDTSQRTYLHGKSLAIDLTSPSLYTFELTFDVKKKIDVLLNSLECVNLGYNASTYIISVHDESRIDLCFSMIGDGQTYIDFGHTNVSNISIYNTSSTVPELVISGPRMPTYDLKAGDYRLSTIINTPVSDIDIPVTRFTNNNKTRYIDLEVDTNVYDELLYGMVFEYIFDVIGNKTLHLNHQSNYLPDYPMYHIYCFNNFTTLFDIELMNRNILFTNGTYKIMMDTRKLPYHGAEPKLRLDFSINVVKLYNITSLEPGVPYDNYDFLMGGEVNKYTVRTSNETYGIYISINKQIPTTIFLGDSALPSQFINDPQGASIIYALVSPNQNYTVVLGDENTKIDPDNFNYTIEYNEVLKSQYNTYTIPITDNATTFSFVNLQSEVSRIYVIEFISTPRYLITWSDTSDLMHATYEVNEKNLSTTTVSYLGDNVIQKLEAASKYQTIFYAFGYSGRTLFQPIYEVEQFAAFPETYGYYYYQGVQFRKYVNVVRTTNVNNTLHIYYLNSSYLDVEFYSINTTTYYMFQSTMGTFNIAIVGNGNHANEIIGGTLLYVYQPESGLYNFTLYYDPTTPSFRSYIPPTFEVCSSYKNNYKDLFGCSGGTWIDQNTIVPTDISPTIPTNTINYTTPPTRTPTPTPTTITTCQNDCRTVFSFNKKQDCQFGRYLIEILQTKTNLSICMNTSASDSNNDENTFEYGTYQPFSSDTTGTITEDQSNIDFNKLLDFVQQNSNFITSTINSYDNSHDSLTIKLSVVSDGNNIVDYTCWCLSAILLYFIL